VDAPVAMKSAPEAAPAPEPDFDPSAVRSAWLDTDAEANNAVAVVMRKGGAGKTTTVLNQADALARFGLSVLVVDMDPQGNASIGLGRKVHLIETGRTRVGNKPIKTPKAVTVCEVIESGERGVADAAIALASDDWEYPPDDPFTRGGPLFPGRPGVVGLIPCYKKLEMDAHSWNPKDLERLATALLLPAEPDGIAPHRRWDVVLIDTPPGGSLISVHAAKAAHKALFVSPPAKFGANAIPETMELVEDIRDHYHHPKLEVIGLILNEYIQQGRLTQRNITAQLEQSHRAGHPLYAAPLWGRVPDYTVIQDAQDSEVPVSWFLASSSKRETARGVCQATEEHAIRLLEAIRHPRATEISAAWQGAWPMGPDAQGAVPDGRKSGRHRRPKRQTHPAT
jgi:cellulose biosynthesis protein BcsQ